MRPSDALNEIAFLLEQERAPRFRVQAFRKAGAAIAGLDEDALRARADAGSLQAIKGIGDRTAGIIADALTGAVPQYLLDLRAATPPLPRSALRGRLQGDLHAHSEWTDGSVPIETMADAAAELGHAYLVLTDHSPSLRVAGGLPPERLREQLGVVASYRRDGFRLLSGIEVDILADGALDQEPDLLDELDVVVASVHSKLRDDEATMTARMLAAIRNPRTDVLGHCTGRRLEGKSKRPQSDFDAEAVFAACAEHGVAVEINGQPERQDPPDDLLALALAAGCLFSVDSDAHAPGELTFVDRAAARAEAAGVPADRVINTWPVERLLEWTRA